MKQLAQEIATGSLTSSGNLWPKRLFVLDVSRGFAALAVVLWHWQHFAYTGTTAPRHFDRASQPLYAALKIFYEKGDMGVEYFFLLSGFVFFWLYRSSIKNRNTSLWDFWVQRISRLYPLHVITLLIVLLLQGMYISHSGNFFVYPCNDLYHFVLNLGFASKWGFESGWSFNGPVWSVSIEILLYCLFFLVAYNRGGGMLFCFGISVISFVIKQFPHHHAVFGGLALFFLGGFVFDSTLLISTRWRKLTKAICSVAILSWLLVIFSFYVYDLSGSITRIGVIGKILLTGFPTYILLPFTVSGLVLTEIERGQWLKPISWVGDITYSSYLLHFPLQLVFGLVVSYGFLNSKFYLDPVYLGIFFLMLIPLSYITYIGFEHPMQNVIRNRYRSCLKTGQPSVQEGL